MSLKAWIAPARTALLLIDMQADFAAKDGAMARQGADMTTISHAVENAERLAEAARAAGVVCIFVRLITRPGADVFLQEWNARRGMDASALCREGSPGAAFVGPQPQGGEMVFSKRRYNAFHGTGLDAALKDLGVDTLVVAGLTTECCIDSSVRGAFERDYHVYVAADATACYEAGLHPAALRALALNCALSLHNPEILAAWKT